MGRRLFHPACLIRFPGYPALRLTLQRDKARRRLYPSLGSWWGQAFASIRVRSSGTPNFSVIRWVAPERSAGCCKTLHLRCAQAGAVHSADDDALRKTQHPCGGRIQTASQLSPALKAPHGRMRMCVQNYRQNSNSRSRDGWARNPLSTILYFHLPVGHASRRDVHLASVNARTLPANPSLFGRPDVGSHSPARRWSD